MRIIDSLEPVLYDSMGSALYCHQIGRDTAMKAVADAARIVAKRVDEEDM